MKKILALALALIIAAMALCFAGCGSKENTDEPSAAPEAAKTFIMGIDPEYPPFSFMDDNGNYTGFDVEICKAACDYLGWEFKVFGVNWDNKLIQLDAGECDCVWSGMTILDSMKEAGYVLSAPYYDNTQVLLVKDDSEFKTSADLAGKDVAVQLGTSGESLLKDDESDLKDLAASFNKIVTCDSFLKCFTELTGNAVDAVFVDKPVAENYAAENEGFRIIDENLGAEQYGIAFRSGDAELCASIESAVAALVENGTYAQIAEKYPEVVNNLLFIK